MKPVKQKLFLAEDYPTSVLNNRTTTEKYLTPISILMKLAIL